MAPLASVAFNQSAFVVVRSMVIVRIDSDL